MSRMLKLYNDTNTVYIVPHSKLPYTMLKNSKSKTINGNIIKINSHGFRDFEYNIKKNDDIFRIIIIGDSTTYGYGVQIEDTYPKQLEKLLNTKFINNKFEVLNMGHVGFNLIDYYNLLNEKGIKFEPDIIIFGVMRNDFNLFSKEDHPKIHGIIKDGVMMRDNSIWTRYQVPPIIITYLRNSAFYLTLGNAIKNYRLRKNSNSNLVANPEPDLKMEQIETERIADGIKVYTSKLAKLVEKIDSRIYYAYLPVRFELEKGEHHYKTWEEILKIQPKISKNIKYIDLVNLSDNNPRIIKKMFPKQDPAHPTRFGHGLYAEKLLEEITNSQSFINYLKK